MMLRLTAVSQKGLIGVAATSVLSVAAAVVVAVPPAQAAPNPVTLTDAGTAQSEAEAIRAAITSGERVEVLSERTELSQLFAEPTGGLTYEAGVVPQRVHRADGSWHDIDLTLAKGRDGAVRPAASTADVRFSGGGNGPLVTMVRQGSSLTVGWPLGPLPTPTLAGDAATYPGVLSGVDLVVSATEQGFTHVLVVKTAKAAAQPALRSITYDMGGDARVSRLPNGSLRAVANGALVATADVPAMWDSSASVGTGQVAGQNGIGISSAAKPGDTAQVADVATAVNTAGDLVLTPDARMLSETATYPVYIDPEWSKGKTRWAYATNNNASNGDTSVARVGKDPTSSKIYRSFFEFPTTEIKNKHIESAYVQMELDHSWSCDDTWTTMFHTAVIASTPRTTWSPRMIKKVAAATSHGNEAGGCGGTADPDMTVNFSGGNVTLLVQTVANKGATNLTVGFCACNENFEYESVTDRWKKFFPSKARLIANVDAKPGKPTGLQVAGVACISAGVSIGTTTPKFSATFPDADAGQSIKGTWEWAEAPVGQSMIGKTAPPATSASANTRRETQAVSGATNGKRFAFRVKGTDPAPYLQESPWSDWCFFTVDTAVPPVAVEVVELPAGPGMPGRFALSTPADDAATFRYGWSEAVTSAVIPDSVPGTPGKSATVTLTAPKYGINVLYVQAIDTANNKGYGSTEFLVGRPAPPVARFGLETYPGVDQPRALSDGQPTLGGDTPLTPANVTWVNDTRVLGGAVATVSGTSSALTTVGPVVDTTGSVSVAGWVRLAAVPSSADMGIAVQEGIDTAGFQLGTRLEGAPLTPRWSFLMKDADQQSSVTRAAVTSTAITAADVGRWTHIAGVYDRPAGKVRLYVNGKMAAEADRTAAPWAAPGRFAVGRGFSAGAPGGWAKASVVDVQVFGRVLVNHDFTGQLATDQFSGGVDEPGILAPVGVGRWGFDTAVACYQADTPGACAAPDGSAWSRRLRLTEGTGVDRGNRGPGLALSDVHFVEDPNDPKFGQATRQYGGSQRNVGPEGEAPLWQDAPVLRTDQSFTVSVWVQTADVVGTETRTAVAQRGNKMSAFYLGTRMLTVAGVATRRWAVMTVNKDEHLGETSVYVFAPSPLVDGDDAWTHLTVVYDAGAQQLRLYVNGDLAASAAQAPLWNAGGPLTVGSCWHTLDAGISEWRDQWRGGVDDLFVYQGAMTDAQVLALHDQQSAIEEEPWS